MKEAILLIIFASFLFAVSGAPCCGNGRCEYPMEDCRSCPRDCGVCPACNTCGNRICDVSKGETSCNCPLDCGPCCVDGICREDKNETALNCPKDCAVNLNLVVVDADTGATLTGAAVRCSTPTVTLGPRNSGNKGDVQFAGIQGGIYVCTGELFAYLPGVVTATVYPLSDPKVWVIPLKQNPSCLEGTVYDAVTLVPLDISSVFCKQTSASGATSFTTSTRITGTMGKYYFEPVPYGDYRCFASRTKYYPNSNDGTVPPGKMGIVDIYLQPLPGGIIGHVWNQAGMTPLSGVTITCTAANGEVKTTTTDKTGFYSIQNVTAGPASCTASLPDFTSQTKFGTVFRSENTTIDFIIAEIPGSLVIFVGEDPTRVIIPGARVECSSAQVPLLTGVTNANGTVSFFQVTPGNFTCTGSAAGYISNTIFSVIVNRNKNSYYEILLKPQPGLLIITAVDDSTNIIMPNVTVTVTPGGYPVTFTDITGTTTYTVASGTYSAVGTFVGYIDGVKNGFFVPKGGITRVELRLVPLPGLLICNVVASDTGNPLPGATIVMSGGPISNTTVAPAPTASVSYVIRNYIAYTCAGSFPNYYDDQKTSEVIKRGSTVTIKLVLVPKPNRLVVIVKELVTEKLITNAFVSLTPSSFSEGAVDAAASITYDPLNPGVYTASARATGYNSNSTAVPGIDAQTHGAVVVVVIYLKPIPCTVTVRTVLASDNSLLAGVSVSVTGFNTQITTATGTFTYTITDLPLNGVVSASISGYTSSGDQNFACGLNGTFVIVIRFTPIPNKLIVIVKELVTEKLITTAFVAVTVSSFPETAVDAAASATFEPLPSGVYVAAARASGYASNSTAVPGIDRTTNAAVVTVIIYLKPIPCSITVRTVLASDNSLLAGVAVSVTGFNTQITTSSGTFSYSITDYTATGVISGSLAGYTSSGDQNFACGLNGTFLYIIKFTPIPNKLIVIVKEQGTEALITSAFVLVSGSTFPESAVDAAASATFEPLDPGVYTANARATGYTSNSTGVPGIDKTTRGVTVTVTIYLKPIPCTLTVRTVLASDNSVITGVAVSVTGFGVQVATTGTLTYTLTALPASGVANGELSGYTTNGDQSFSCGLNGTVTVVIRLIPIPNQIIVTVLDARTFELITTAFVTLTPGFGTEVAVDGTASTTYAPVPAGSYTAFARAAGYSSNSTGPTTVLRNQTVRVFVYLTQLPCLLRVVTLTTQNTSLVIAGANLAINNGQANRTTNAAGIVDYVLPYNNATRISGSKTSYGSNFTDFTCGKGDNVTVIVYLPEILTIVFAAVDAKSPNNPYINANITFNGELIPADPNDSRFHYKAVDSLPLTGIVVATSAGFNDQTDTGIRFTLTRRNYTISLAPQEFTLYFTPVELIKSSTETRGFFESRLDGSGYLPNNYFDLNPTELRTDVAYIPKPIQIGGSTIRNTSPQTSNAYTANVTITFVDFSSVTVLASKFDNVSPPPLDSFTILPSPISGMVANWAAANITGNEVVINVPPFASTAERNLLTNYPYQLASGYIMLRVVARLPDARTATAFGDNDFVAATITLGKTSQFTNYNSKNIPLGGKVKCFFEFPLAFQSGVTDIQVTAPLQTYNLTLSNFLNPDTGALTTAKSGPAYEAYTKFTFTLGTSIFSQTSTGQQARDPKASLSITRDYALVLLPAKKRSD